MARKHNIRRNFLRAAALASVSLLALPAAAQTSAQPVKPMYGNLRPFYGNLRPFYGNLRPFYGNLRPFYGNLRPFWGDTGAFYGDLKSFWGVSDPVVGAGAPDYLKVADFWAKAGEDWTVAFNTLGSTSPDYGLAAGKIDTVLSDSRAFWGASVQAKTGENFDEGFLKPFLAKRGLGDVSDLSDLSRDDLAYLFLEYYDQLMTFAGTDHVDHWMRTVNWSPALSRTQGLGEGVAVGLLDQSINTLERTQITQYRGASAFSDGHGDAVASLIVGAHDGRGVMGIAPMASVVGYNPFDETGTASWADVTQGVRMLKASGASVVNMSLGVPGKTFDPGWNNVFANLGTTLILKNTVFVLAAGNEGVTQTQNVNWSPLNPAVVIVGSVDLEGKISSFSNRPGEACLSTLGLLCLPGQKLKNHFIVAPGELLLVSDGQGGVTRQMGTSLAAPLVSGAIALIHSRWPWLANHPHETLDIIFESAKDLGAPGVDSVYGHGLLDVEASQSPLNFSKLIWYTVKDGKQVAQTRSGVVSTYQSGDTATWDAQGAYFYAFEPLGLLGLVQRDFAIPLSSKLIGQNVTTRGGSQEFQSYLLSRMDAWVATQTQRRLAYSGGNAFAPVNMAVPNAWGADMSVTFAPRQARFGFRDEGPAYQSALKIQGERSSVTFGFGDGAPALAQTGFTDAADYDSERGGANPLLGLASGGAYVGWSYGLSDRLQLSAGAMRRHEERDTRLLPALGVVGNGAEEYAADAQVMALTFRPSSDLTLSGSYTRLHEGSGLLGVQSLDPADFRKGSTSDGLTVGLSWAPTAKLSFAATGTLGRTRASDAGQALAVDEDGLITTAFEAAAAYSGLFAKGDTARVSVSQPMYVERGKLNVSTVQVVDRSTGEIGIVTQSFAVSDQRRLAAEFLYAVPVSQGRGDVALFGRAESETAGERTPEYFAGARYRIGF